MRTIIVLSLIVTSFWYFYGKTLKQSGFQSVLEEIQGDVSGITENPEVISAVNIVGEEMQFLFNELALFLSDTEKPTELHMKKPQIDVPSEQSFSIHNVELGHNRSEVEQQVGQPKRSTINEYGVDWNAYHTNYHNFFMVAYDEQNQAAGLYTNQDLLSSTNGITFNLSRDDVLTLVNEPLTSIRKGFVHYKIESNQEYDLFLIDNQYVTIFYDKHEDHTVTAIQIISEELEQQRKAYFGDPNAELKKGFEYQLFDLTNATRVKHDLPILTWEESIRQTARDHSTDMANNNFFGHTNLKGESPSDRLTADGINFRMAGENLATGQVSSIFAHEGLMNSLGHRKNILHQGYQSLAVGVDFNTHSQPFYTEKFLTK